MGGKLIISKGSLVVMKGKIQPNCLYRLCGTIVIGRATISTKKDSVDDTQLWHLRLRHMSEQAMQELHKRKLLKGVHNCKLEFCKYCTMGKQSNVTFKQQDKENRSTGVLDYIHPNVWGPTLVKSLGVARYNVIFLDDFSRKVWVYFMKEKYEVFTNSRNGRRN
ncbi:hypothetical protein L3X38_025193 [Prunus dulcis]|uniref:GAG-pre-integrase domain-containing protein n=1 Tax=Prunus dulcis TaxID=3755 RepID=A0AAD4W1A3_PRUDU|nr:hypothetical protein L3X38_025193 [Prunus dulcis]